MLLCHDVSDADIEPLALRIGETLGRPLVLDGTEALVSDLLRRADAAMYEAKRAGGGTRLLRVGPPGAVAA